MKTAAGSSAPSWKARPGTRSADTEIIAYLPRFRGKRALEWPPFEAERLPRTYRRNAFPSSTKKPPPAVPSDPLGRLFLCSHRGVGSATAGSGHLRQKNGQQQRTHAISPADCRPAYCSEAGQPVQRLSMQSAYAIQTHLHRGKQGPMLYR